MVFRLTFLLIFWISASSFAQDLKLASAINAYNLGQDQKALGLFNEVLSTSSSLSASDLPKAYFYSARTKLTIYQDAMATGSDEEIVASEALLFSAYEDYQSAKSNDDGNWAAKIDADLEVMYSNALRGAINGINSAYSAGGSVKAGFVNRSEQMIDLALKINRNHYLAHDILGQVLQEKNQIVPAIDEFDIAQNQYPKTGQPDFMIAYTYYRSALGYRAMDQLQSALNELRAGADLLDSEHQRYISGGQSDAKLVQQYRRAKSDLKNLELDIYLNYPDKLDEAVATFRQEASNDPGNYTKALAYASLLEKVDPLEAIDAYLTAIEIDPGKEEANFNLGALYNNLAADLSDKARKEIDIRTANSMQFKAKDHMGNALLYFEQAFEINESLRTVIALKQITQFLQLEEKHQFYVEKEIQLLER